MEYNYIFDGTRMGSKDEFYEEVYGQLVGDSDFAPGKNLDAFNDILRGGFGKHLYGEKINILWKNFSAAKQNLGTEFLLTVVEIILNNSEDHDCILKVD